MVYSMFEILIMYNTKMYKKKPYMQNYMLNLEYKIFIKQVIA